jgi:hypothetical protein
MSFWGELRRHNVFNVGAAYVIVAWLTAQVISVLNEPLTLPDWFDTVVVLFLAAGFPIALLLAWAYEITPDGVKPTAEVQRSESITHVTGRSSTTS